MNLEKRVAELEKRVQELQRVAPQTEIASSKDRLMQIFGRAKDDPYFESAAMLGAQWREEANRRSLEELDAHS